jgi:hypothetical protein
MGSPRAERSGDPLDHELSGASGATDAERSFGAFRLPRDQGARSTREKREGLASLDARADGHRELDAGSRIDRVFGPDAAGPERDGDQAELQRIGGDEHAARARENRIADLRSR